MVGGRERQFDLVGNRPVAESVSVAGFFLINFFRRINMFRKVLLLVAMIVAMPFCFAVEAAQISCHWIGGKQGIWEDANSWSCGFVPHNDENNTFAVTIDNRGNSDNVHVDVEEEHIIDSLEIWGEVNLERRLRGDYLVLAYAGDFDLALEVKEGLTNHGDMEIADVTIIGNVMNDAGAIFNGSGLETDIGNGGFFNSVGAIIDCDTDHISIDWDLLNHGIISCGIETESRLQNWGFIEIHGDTCSSEGAFINESEGRIKGFGAIHSDEVVNNAGEIHATRTGLVVTGNALVNTGTIDCGVNSSLYVETVHDVNNYGNIIVNASGIAIDPNLINEPNGIIKLLGGTLGATMIVQRADAIFSGFGTIKGDVSIDHNGIISLTGPTNIVGDMQIGTDATLEISDGTTLIIGHTTCNNGTIHMVGGRLICQGGLTNNNCDVVWEPGLYTNMADFNLDGKVNFEDFAYFADVWLWQAKL